MYYSSRINIRKEKNKIFSLMRLSVLSISFLTAFFVLINSQQHKGYGLYFLVPLLFGLLFFICKDATKYIFKRLGLTVMFVVMIFRYLVLPFVACLGGYMVRLGIEPSDELLNWGVILTLTEMCTMYCVTTICAIRISKKEKSLSLLVKDKQTNKTNNKKDSCKNIGLKNEISSSQKSDKFLIKPIKSSIIYIGVILLAISTIVIVPEAVSDYRFIFSNSDYKETIRVTFSMAGLFKTVISFAQYIAVLLVINYSYKKYLKYPHFRYTLYAMIAVLINMTVTSNLSRFTILIPTVTFTYLLTKIFPKEKKKIVFIIFGCLIAGLVFISAIKFFGEGRGSSDNASDITWWADTFQMYFAGVKNIAIAINANTGVQNLYGFLRIKLLFTDLFSNVAVVSNFVPAQINSISIFNYFYYGSDISVDQIVPLIGTGYFYFGYVFAPLWTAFSVLILFWLDEKALNSQYIDQKFIFNYVSVYFGLATILNTSTVYSTIINNLLLFLIILKVNKFVVIRK